MTKEELLEKAKLLPLTPGVYLMRNKAGTVIYVGKSKALKNRVSSYFSPSVPHYGKTEKMIRSVDDLRCITPPRSWRHCCRKTLLSSSICPATTSS